MGGTTVARPKPWVPGKRHAPFGFATGIPVLVLALTGPLPGRRKPAAWTCALLHCGMVLAERGRQLKGVS